MNPAYLRPLTQRLRFGPNREMAVGPNVPLLLFERGPPTVARLIVSGAINTVDGVSFRTKAHVSEKIVEGLPSFANRDAFAPIRRIFGVARVVAAALHGVPCLVSRCGGRIPDAVPMTKLRQAIAARFRAILTSTEPARRCASLECRAALQALTSFHRPCFHGSTLPNTSAKSQRALCEQGLA